MEGSTKGSASRKGVNEILKTTFKFITSSKVKRYWLLSSLIIFTVSGFIIDVSLFAISSTTAPLSAASSGNVGSGAIPGLTKNQTTQPSNQTGAITRPPPVTETMEIQKISSEHPITEFYGQNISSNTHPLFLVDGSPEDTFWRLTAFDRFEKNGTWLKDSSRTLNTIEKTIYGGYPPLILTKKVFVELWIESAPNTILESYLPLPWAYNESTLVPSSFQFVGDDNGLWNLTNSHSSPYHDYKISVLSPYLPDVANDASATLKVKLKYDVTIPIKPLSEFIPTVVGNYSSIPDWILLHYLQRPSGMTVILLPFLTRVQDPNLGYWGQIVALKGNITSTFIFDPNKPPKPRPNIISDMINNPNNAYSSYDIASFTVLAARALNVPARLVMGFRQSVSAENGPQFIGMNDLFFWPEVFIPKYGWLPLNVFSEPTYTIEAKRVVGNFDRPFDVWNVSLLLNGQEHVANTVFTIKEIINGSTSLIGYATSNADGHALLYFNYLDFSNGSHRILITDLKQRAYQIITLNVPHETTYQGRLSPDPSIIKHADQVKVTSDPGFTSNGTDGIGWVIWNATLTANDTNPLNITFQLYLTTEEGNFSNIQVKLTDLSDNLTLKTLTYTGAPVTWSLTDTNSLSGGDHSVEVKLTYQSNAFGGRTVTFSKIIPNLFNIPRGGRIATSVNPSSILAGYAARVNMSFYDANDALITDPNQVTDIQVLDQNYNLIHQASAPFANATYAFILQTNPSWVPASYTFTVKAKILGATVSGSFTIQIINPLQADPNNVNLIVSHNATNFQNFVYPVIFRGEEGLQVNATLTYLGQPLIGQTIELTDSRNKFNLQAQSDDEGNVSFIIPISSSYPEGNVTLTLTYQVGGYSKQWTLNITVLDPYQISVKSSSTSAIRARTELAFNITLSYRLSIPANGIVTIVDLTDNVLIANFTASTTIIFNYTFPVTSSIGQHSLEFSFKTTKFNLTILVKEYQPSLHVVRKTDSGIRGLDNATYVVYVSQNGLTWTDPNSIPEANVNLTFISITDNVSLGHAITNSSGFAEFSFKIPSTWSLGNHTIQVKVQGSSIHLNLTLTVEEGFDLILLVNGILNSSQLVFYQLIEESTINLTTYVTFANQPYTNTSNPLTILLQVNGSLTSQNDNILTYTNFYDHSQIYLTYNYTFKTITPAGQVLVRTVLLTILPHAWTLDFRPNFTPSNRDLPTNTTTVYRNTTILSWNMTVLQDGLPFSSGNMTIELDGVVITTLLTDQYGNASFSHWFDANAQLKTYNLTVYLTKYPHVKHTELIIVLQDYRFDYNVDLIANTTLVVANGSLRLDLRMVRYNPDNRNFSQSVLADYWYYYKNSTFTSANTTILSNINLTTFYKHNISITTPTFTNGTYTFYVFANSSTGVLLYVSFTIDVFAVNFTLDPTPSMISPQVVDYGNVYTQTFTLKLENGSAVPNTVVYFNLTNKVNLQYVFTATTDGQGNLTLTIPTLTLPYGGKYYFYPYILATSTQGQTFLIWNGTTLEYSLLVRQWTLNVTMSDVITSKTLPSGSDVPRNVTILQINYNIILAGLTLDEALTSPIMWINDSVDSRLNIALNLTEKGLTNSTIFNTYLDTPLGLHTLTVTVQDTNLTAIVQFNLISKFRILSANINGTSSGTLSVTQGQQLNASVTVAAFNVTAANQTYSSNPSLTFSSLLGNLTHYDVIQSANGTAQFTLSSNLMNVTITLGNGTNTWTIDPLSFFRGVYPVSSLEFYLDGQNYSATSTTMYLTVYIKEPLKLNVTYIPAAVNWNEYWFVAGYVYNPLTNQTLDHVSLVLNLQSTVGSINSQGYPDITGFFNITANINDNTTAVRNFIVTLSADTSIFDVSNATFTFNVSVNLDVVLVTTAPPLMTFNDNEQQNISWKLFYAHNSSDLASQKIILQIVELNLNITRYTNQSGWADFSILWNLTQAYRQYTLRAIYEGNNTAGVLKTIINSIITNVQGPIYIRNDYIAATSGNNSEYVIRGQEMMLWGRILFANGSLAPLGLTDLTIYSVSNATDGRDVILFANGRYNITIRAWHWTNYAFIGKLVINITLSVLSQSKFPYYINNDTHAIILSVAQLTITTYLNEINPVLSSAENKIANGTQFFFNITVSEINPTRPISNTDASYLTISARWNDTLLSLSRVNATWNSNNVTTSTLENITYILEVNITSSLSQTYYLNATFTYTFVTKSALQLVFKNVPARIQPSQTLIFDVEIHHGGPNGPLYDNSTTVNIQVNRTDTNVIIYSQQWSIGASSSLPLSIPVPADLKPGAQLIIHGEIVSLPESLAIQLTPDQYVDVVQDPSSMSFAVTTPPVTSNNGINYYYENTSLLLSVSVLFPYYTIGDFSQSEWSLTFSARDVNDGTVLNTTANFHNLTFTYTPSPDVGFINLSLTLNFQHGATTTTFQRFVLVKIITDVSFTISAVTDLTGQTQVLSSEPGILTIRADKTISVEITARDQQLNELLFYVPVNNSLVLSPTPANFSIGGLPLTTTASGIITFTITLTSTALLENFTVTISLNNNNFSFTFKLVMKADVDLSLFLGNNFGSYYLEGTQLYLNLSLSEQATAVTNPTSYLNQGTWSVIVDFYLDGQIIISDRISKSNGDVFPSFIVHELNDLPAIKTHGLLQVQVQLQWDRAYTTPITKQQQVTVIRNVSAFLVTLQPNNARLITQDVIALKRASGQVLSITANVTIKDAPSIGLQSINVTTKFVNDNKITVQSVLTDSSGSFNIAIPINFSMSLGNKSLSIWWQVNGTETIVLFNYTIMVQGDVSFSKTILRTTFLETQMDGEDLSSSEFAVVAPANGSFNLNDVPYIRFILTATDDNNTALTTSSGFGHYQFIIGWDFVNGTKRNQTITTLISATNNGQYLLKINDPFPRMSATIKIYAYFVPDASYEGILPSTGVEIASITYYGQLEIDYLGRTPGPDYDPNAARNATTSFIIEALEPVIFWFEVKDLGFNTVIPSNIISPEFNLNFTVINSQTRQVIYQTFITDDNLDASTDGRFHVGYSESATGPREMHVSITYNLTATNLTRAISSTEKIISFTLAPASMSIFTTFSDNQTGQEITVAIMGDAINVTAYVSPLDKHVQPIPFPQVSSPGTVQFEFNTTVLINNIEQSVALATSIRTVSPVTYAFSLVFTLKNDVNPYTLQVTSSFLVSPELASYGYSNGTSGSVTLDVHSNPEITIGSLGVLQRTAFVRHQGNVDDDSLSSQAASIVLKSKYGEEYTLAGRLSDGNQPLSGFRVEIIVHDQNSSTILRTVTYSDTNGIFQAELQVTRDLYPKEGNYTITLRLTDFANPPSQNVTFQVFIPTQVIAHATPKYVTKGDQVTIVGYLVDDLGNNVTSVTQARAITINGIPVDIINGKFTYNHTISSNDDANFVLTLNYLGNPTIFLDPASIDIELATLTNPIIDIIHGPLTMITNQSGQFLAQVSIYVLTVVSSMQQKDYLNDRPVQLILNGNVLWQGELNGTDFSLTVMIKYLSGNEYEFRVAGGNPIRYQLQLVNGSSTEWQPIDFTFQLLTTTETPIEGLARTIRITPISLSAQVIPLPPTTESTFPTIGAVVFVSSLLMWLSFLSAIGLVTEPWIRHQLKIRRQKKPMSEMKKELSDLLDSLTTTDEEIEDEEGADLASLLEWAIEEEQREASQDELETLEDFTFELPPIFQELLEMLKLKQYNELIAKALEETLDLMRKRYNIYRLSETETIREWEGRALTTPIGQQKRAHIKLLYDVLSEGNYWPEHVWTRQDAVNIFRAFVTLYPDLVDMMTLPEEQRRGISIIARVILKMGQVKQKDEFEEYL